MEEGTQNAEVISQELLKDIFSDFEAAAPKAEEKPAEEATVTEDVKALLGDTVVPEQKAEVKEESTKVATTDYSKRLQAAIKDGLIENFAITYNDEEAYLEDIQDLTEEGYNQIIQGWKDEKDKNLKEKYISTDDFDEQTKKLIEIKRSGGDITQLIEKNVTAMEQVQRLKENIDDQKVQINIVGHNLEQKGLSKRVIQAQIEELIEQGELEAEATTILDYHYNQNSEAIELKRQEEAQRVITEKEDLKNLRKTLSATYKEFGVPDNIQKTLVENATKLDKDKISNTDKLYFEAIKDPKRYAEINYFLNNPEEFKKWISSNSVLKTKLENTNNLFKININNQKKPKISSTSLEEYADEVFRNNK